MSGTPIFILPNYCNVKHVHTKFILISNTRNIEVLSNRNVGSLFSYLLSAFISRRLPPSIDYFNNYTSVVPLESHRSSNNHRQRGGSVNVRLSRYQREQIKPDDLRSRSSARKYYAQSRFNHAVR